MSLLQAHKEVPMGRKYAQMAQLKEARAGNLDKKQVSLGRIKQWSIDVAILAVASNGNPSDSSRP